MTERRRPHRRGGRGPRSYGRTPAESNGEPNPYRETAPETPVDGGDTIDTTPPPIVSLATEDALAAPPPPPPPVTESAGETREQEQRAPREYREQDQRPPRESRTRAPARASAAPAAHASRRGQRDAGMVRSVARRRLHPASSEQLSRRSRRRVRRAASRQAVWPASRRHDRREHGA
jgi:hypothetical protein